MSRSMAFVFTLLSLILVAVVIAGKYFGISVPVLGTIVAGKSFEVMLVAYVLLLLPAILR